MHSLWLCKEEDSSGVLVEGSLFEVSDSNTNDGATRGLLEDFLAQDVPKVSLVGTGSLVLGPAGALAVLILGRRSPCSLP